MYRDIPEALRELFEPVIADHQCELVDVEQVSGGPAGLLRIVIDNPTGDGRVSIERCADVSREIETLLDASDAIPGQYKLEVSSPGLDRVLGREKDVLAAVGQLVKMVARRPLDGRRRFKGRLIAFEDDVARLEMDDATEALVPFAEIEKANIVYEFTAADFGSEADEKKSAKGAKSTKKTARKSGKKKTGTGGRGRPNRRERRG